MVNKLQTFEKFLDGLSVKQTGQTIDKAGDTQHIFGYTGPKAIDTWKINKKVLKGYKKILKELKKGGVRVEIPGRNDEYPWSNGLTVRIEFDEKYNKNVEKRMLEIEEDMKILGWYTLEGGVLEIRFNHPKDVNKQYPEGTKRRYI